MARRTDRWHRRFSHSIKWRLVALFLLLAVGVSATFLYSMQKALASGWREAIKPLLVDYVDRLAAEIGSPPDVAKAQALVASLPISVRISGPTVQFDSHPAHTPTWQKYRGNTNWHDGASHADEPSQGELEPNRLLQRKTADGHTIVFGLGDLAWRRGPDNLVWITLLALLALTAVAYLYVRRLLKPLDDIGAGAQRFGTGDFGQPIPVRRRDELGDLAGQINTMAADIHQMLEAKRGLLLAISHELRSPLTRARLNAELLPEEAGTGPTRAAIQRDLVEMGRLISDLLESERLSTRHGALRCELIDVAALANEVVQAVMQGVMNGAVASPSTEVMPADPIHVGAQSTRIQVHIAPDLPLMQLDPVRIRLLLRNLLDNALRYAPHPGPACELHLRRMADQVVLRVRDYGPGVDAAHLPDLTQPFYRPDSSRQRSTGGVGLGLYLCRLVVQAHGGQITLKNASPGLEVTVTLAIGLDGENF